MPAARRTSAPAAAMPRVDSCRVPKATRTSPIIAAPPAPPPIETGGGAIRGVILHPFRPRRPVPEVPRRDAGPGPVVSSAPVTDPRPAAPGGLRLGSPPAGLPDPNVAPPVVAEPGDPFAVLRVLELVARVERGRPVLLDDLVASLNARYLDWVFDLSLIHISEPTRLGM